MNPHTFIFRAAPAVLLSAAFLIGCRKQDTVSTYSAPKDPANSVTTDIPPVDAPAPSPVRVQPAAADPSDQIPTWTVPPGWQTMPAGQVAVAKFAATSDSQVICSVTKFGGDGGGMLANINRWEKELALPVSTEAELARLVKQTHVGGEPAVTVNLVGPAGAAGGQETVLAAIVVQGDLTWFFKMKGPADKVAAQQANFDAFLHSWQFVSASAEEQAGSTGPAVEPTFPTPKGWVKEQATNSMRLASYKIGSGDDQAEVIVSKMPVNNVGTYEANMTRWRDQVGLPADAQAVSPKNCTVAGLPGQSFDLIGPTADGKKARRLLIYLTEDTQDNAWFFKIIGPTDIVSQQQAAFEQFLNGVKLAGTPAK